MVLRNVVRKRICRVRDAIFAGSAVVVVSRMPRIHERVILTTAAGEFPFTCSLLVSHSRGKERNSATREHQELDARTWPTTETDVEVPAIIIVHAAAANTTIVQCRSSWW